MLFSGQLKLADTLTSDLCHVTLGGPRKHKVLPDPHPGNCRFPSPDLNDSIELAFIAPAKLRLAVR